MYILYPFRVADSDKDLRKFFHDGGARQIVPLPHGGGVEQFDFLTYRWSLLAVFSTFFAFLHSLAI